MIEFKSWGKIPRLSKSTVSITEKIDGTNACVVIMPHCVTPVHLVDREGAIDVQEVNGQTYAIGAQSRNKLIFPGKNTDNAGFAGWVAENAEELIKLLGPGYHYGEWWGQGIQRGYGLDHKVFSLFNTHVWGKKAQGIESFLTRANDINLSVVPELYIGPLDSAALDEVCSDLRQLGSVAASKEGNTAKAPAEGVILYHHDLKAYHKVLLENDDRHKGEL